MNLIDNNKIVQVLNRDGRLDYYGKITTNVEANLYFEILLQNIVWKNDEAIILGNHIIIKRKLHGTATLIIYIHIQILQDEHYHGLANLETLNNWSKS